MLLSPPGASDVREKRGSLRLHRRSTSPSSSPKYVRFSPDEKQPESAGNNTTTAKAKSEDLLLYRSKNPDFTVDLTLAEPTASQGVKSLKKRRSTIQVIDYDTQMALKKQLDMTISAAEAITIVVTKHEEHEDVTTAGDMKQKSDEEQQQEAEKQQQPEEQQQIREQKEE